MARYNTTIVVSRAEIERIIRDALGISSSAKAIWIAKRDWDAPGAPEEVRFETNNRNDWDGPGSR